jgi:hypothetical protein
MHAKMDEKTRSRFAVMHGGLVVTKPIRPSLLKRIKWRLDDYFFPEGIEDPRHAKMFYGFMAFCSIGSIAIGTVNVLS